MVHYLYEEDGAASEVADFLGAEQRLASKLMIHLGVRRAHRLQAQEEGLPGAVMAFTVAVAGAAHRCSDESQGG